MDRRSLDLFGPIRSGLSSAELGIRDFGTRVISRHPSLRPPVMQLWCRYMSAYGVSQARWTELRGDHRAAIDPFSVVSVDPERIVYLIEDGGYPNQTRNESTFSAPKFKQAGRVVGGDWDDRNWRFEETDVYRGFEARFERGVPWCETAFYRRSLAYIEDGIELWGCTSEHDFQKRCAFVESLYDSIASHGYRSQSELAAAPSGAVGDDSPAAAPSGDDSRGVETVTDEITVCVGRDGELLFMDGRNRLSIAKILDLDRVPVWIMVRHGDWQRLRDRVAEDPSRWYELPDAVRDHPDLAVPRAVSDV